MGHSEMAICPGELQLETCGISQTEKTTQPPIDRTGICQGKEGPVPRQGMLGVCWPFCPFREPSMCWFPLEGSVLGSALVAPQMVVPDAQGGQTA